MRALSLAVLPDRLSIYRLPPGAPVTRTGAAGLWSVTATRLETSVVAATGEVPPGARAEHGWRCIAVRGTIDFSQTGVLASLAQPLAAAGIPIFALSTFDTDHLLVREDDLERALAALVEHGHSIAATAPASSG